MAKMGTNASMSKAPCVPTTAMRLLPSQLLV